MEKEVKVLKALAHPIRLKNNKKIISWRALCL